MGQTEFRLIKFVNGHVAIRAVMFNAHGKLTGLYLSPPRLAGKSIEEVLEFQGRLAQASEHAVVELDLPLTAWMKVNEVRRLYRGESHRHFEPQHSDSEETAFSYLLDCVQVEHEKFSLYLNDIELGQLQSDKGEVRKRRKPLEDAVLALYYTMKNVLAHGDSLKIYGQRPEGGEMISVMAEITGFQNHIWATYSQTKNGRDRRHCDLTQIERIEVLRADTDPQ